MCKVIRHAAADPVVRRDFNVGVVLLFVASAGLGCGPTLSRPRSGPPLGLPCSNLPLYPLRQAPARPIHRLGIVTTPPVYLSDAALVEALRRAACRRGADAIIDVEQSQPPIHGRLVLRLTGMAVTWVGDHRPDPGPTSSSRSRPPQADPQPPQATHERPRRYAAPAVIPVHLTETNPSMHTQVQADVYAGSLIALRGVTEDLRDELAATRTRDLIWQGTLLMGVSQRFDWNPALDRLRRIVDDEIDRWIDETLAATALVHQEDTAALRNRRLAAVGEQTERIAQALRAVATYLGAIRASQWALHDAKSALILGQGVGLTNAMIDAVEVLDVPLAHLRGLRLSARQEATAKHKLARYAGGHRLDRATDAAALASAWVDSEVQRFFFGIEDGQTALRLSKYPGMVTLAAGLGQAIVAIGAGIRQIPALLATSAAGAGGLRLAIVGGGVVSAAAVDVQAIVSGMAGTLAATTLLMAGGRGPIDVGRAGERSVGIDQVPHIRIESLRGTAKYRVPDRITELTIEEVKNVLKLSRTRQLRDYLKYAQETNRTFILYVRRTTRISKPLQTLIDRGEIIREFLP